MQIRVLVKRQYRNVLSFLLLILRKDGDTVKDKLNTRQKKFAEYYVQSGIDNKEKYTLKEHYGYGYIKYRLYRENGDEIPPNSIEQTKWIDGKGVAFDESIMLAVPCIFGDSEQYKGRGSNILTARQMISMHLMKHGHSGWTHSGHLVQRAIFLNVCYLEILILV